MNPEVWIRFLYTHPVSLTQKIIHTVKDHDNICSYYDVPIQHADTAMLRRMGRPYSHQDLRDLFAMIRKTRPRCGTAHHSDHRLSRRNR
ncbi:MAG: hypothetical protein U5K27_01810 [Desulfotignum sp.]|nr:hypothetical protein [Desulfotignum sp.]